MAVNYAAFLPQQGNQAVAGMNNAAAAAMQISANQAAQAQQQRAAEFQQAFGQAYQSGDNKALTSLIGQYPEQFEQIKQVAGFRDEQGNKAMGSLGIQLATMAKTNPQAAAQLIAQNQDLLRSKGAGYEPETLMKMLAENPEGLAKQADTFSLLALGPDEYYKTTGDRAKIDAQLRGQDITVRGQDIQQAEGAANRSNALNLKQMTIRDKALDREISTLNALAANETNELKRKELELKIQEKQQKLDTGRAEMAESESLAVQSLTDAARLATEILESPNLGSVVGTTTTMLPTFRGESQDLINKANQLTAMLTKDNLKLMTGVLTDKDIQLLGRLSTNLNVQDGGIKGSLAGVQAELGKIATKISENLANRQQASTPSAETVGIDDLINKYAPAPK